jgi:hypothetical protein
MIMIKNLSDYFYSEQEFYLDNLSYNRFEKSENVSEYSLNCTDNIQATLLPEQVRIIITRTVQFDPCDIFKLSVSFGAILRFKEDKKSDYDWDSINLANEFKENGGFVTDNLMTRISLLISEITASYGQPPIVLPPRIASSN